MPKKKKIKLPIPKKCYYGHLDTLDIDDKRTKYYLDQIKQRGWDDTELWSLYTTIAKFTLPRLRRFKEITVGCPTSIPDIEQWKFILECMIKAFEFLSEEKDANTDKDYLDIEIGLNYFRQYFTALWF